MGWCAIRGVIAARMVVVRFVASGRYFGVVAQEAMRWAAVLMVVACDRLGYLLECGIGWGERVGGALF